MSMSAVDYYGEPVKLVRRHFVPLHTTVYYDFPLTPTNYALACTYIHTYIYIYILQVWTNTCCSHPLTGMEPAEIDSPDDVAAGTVPGVQNAAVRKLQHELGLAWDYDQSEFKFLTRLHYWAADTVTHGPASPWGEHEIDYVLIAVVPTKDSVTLTPHPDEVDDVCWVNPDELQAMLSDNTLLFSPWFRLICQKWLVPIWWKDLDGCMNSDKYCDYENIHEFDPPTEHLGGSGNAGLLFPNADTVGDTR